ncbi:MAG: PAS domain-containing protein, partial [Candidatus Marinimicrobia bacterium]|nr:PAS domain-containing protein [Candidatus Neomarinimicrobiota bacterium]
MSTHKKSRTRFSDEVVDLRSRLAELDQIQGVTHGAPTALPAREDLHYQAIRENIGEMVYRVDYDRGRFNGKLTFISPQVKSLTGYSAREFRNNRNLWLDSVHPDDLERFKSVSEAIWASRESGIREYRFLHGKSKTYRWFDDTMVPEFDDSGRLVGSLGVIRDGTDRKSAEHTRNIISEAAERIGDTILITNRQGTMEYVNEALVKLSGYAREELLGQTPRLFKSGQHKSTFYTDFWNSILA